MKLWWFRRKAMEVVRVEAQLDLRDGLLEARADRIAELEQENARIKASAHAEIARLQAALAGALASTWMEKALRQRATAAAEPTVEVPARSIHAPGPTTRRKAKR